MALVLVLCIVSALSVSTAAVVELDTSNETSVERDALVLRVEAAAEGGMNVGASVLAAGPVTLTPITGDVDGIPYVTLVKALPGGRWLIRSDASAGSVRRSVAQQFEEAAEGLHAVAGTWQVLSSD